MERIMDELFDKLAVDTASGISRRQAFRRFGWGVAVAAFAALGVKGVSADSCIPKCCETFCRTVDIPGMDRGQCISDCMRGVSGTQGGFIRAACDQQCAQ